MTSGEIFRIFISWLIPFVSVAAISWFGKCLHNVRTDNAAMKNGLLAIIRSQIVSKCEEYQDRGYLPEYARYCLEDLFKQYKVLGGNHGIEILVENTFELPSSIKKKKGE